MFADGSDGDVGMIDYDHNDNSMSFTTNTNERFRIKSDGKIQFSSATDNIIHTSSNSSRLRLFGGSNESVSNGGVLTLHGVSHSAGNYTDLAAATGGHIQFRIGTSEKLRITSAGSVRVGEDGTFTADTGADELVIGSANNGVNRGMTILNHTGSDGRICFAQSGDPDAGMIKYSHGSNILQFFVESSEIVRIDANAINVYGSDNGSGRVLPAVDNGGYIGESIHRWIAIYAVNGSIQTSDKNEKNTIVESDLGLSFVNKLKPVSYKWNAEHLGNKTHYGLIAQDIEQAIISEGKTLEDFAAVSKDDGAPMSLGYSELIAPLIKAVQDLSAKNDALEARISALEGS